MAKDDFTDGVWRTVGGRRIFIRTGQDLASAMKESGKFNKNTRKKEEDQDDKYARAIHEGFGDYNKDYVPVYDNKIDYTGDFSRANLSSLSEEELTMALNTQNNLYKQALNEKLGDQRTRNGRMDKIFNTAKRQQYENGANKILQEMENRNMPRYNIYNEKNNMLMVSAPTKEIADYQLSDMQRVDKSLQKTYGWQELPNYIVKKERKK